MNISHNDENGFNYSEEFIQTLKEYAIAKQNEQYRTYFDFDMEEHIKFQCNAVENANSKVIRFLKRYKTLNGCKVLELGCGLGGVSVAFALEGSKVQGIDLDADALKAAKRRAKEHNVEVKFNCCDVRDLAFDSNLFDIVICIQVLEHIPKSDQIKALKEIFRVLKKDGLLYIDTPNQYFLRDQHDTDLLFIHWLPKKISLALARMLGRDVPTIEPSSGKYVGLHDYLSYSKIIKTLRKEGKIQILTNFLIYKSLNDFYNDKKNEIDKSFKYRIMLNLLKVIKRLITLNKILPIKVIVRKI